MYLNLWKILAANSPDLDTLSSSTALDIILVPVPPSMNSIPSSPIVDSFNLDSLLNTLSNNGDLEWFPSTSPDPKSTLLAIPDITTRPSGKPSGSFVNASDVKVTSERPANPFGLEHEFRERDHWKRVRMMIWVGGNRT